MSPWYFVAKANYPSHKDCTLSDVIGFKGALTMKMLDMVAKHFKEHEHFIYDGEHPTSVIITFFHRLEEDY